MEGKVEGTWGQGLAEKLNQGAKEAKHDVGWTLPILDEQKLGPGYQKFPSQVNALAKDISNLQISDIENSTFSDFFTEDKV